MPQRGSALYIALFLLACSAEFAAPQTAIQAQPLNSEANSTLTLPAGAKIEIALIRPLWAATASLGTQLYGQTTFPAVVDGSVAIPPGTYVQGAIRKLTRPTRRSNRAEIEMLFTKLVFANGYVAELPAPTSSTAPLPPGNSGALIDVAVQVSARNDLLLDNGAQIEIMLGAPFSLAAKQVAAAIPLSQPPAPGQFKSASLCRPISGTPGTPGTPDTVIPGTPGTPDTVIPGAPGMPPTVIPGTPSTPSTVIPGMPGTPGTPGIYCPAAPMVISSTPAPLTPMQNQNPPAAVVH
jgi:hypothetical protein